MSSWVSALDAAGYAIEEAAVLCRGSSLLAKLSNESSQIGKSAVKHFATKAAIEREQSSDISKVLEHCAKGVLTIVWRTCRIASYPTSRTCGVTLM